MLAGTAIGVYLLVVVGATTALTDAAAACPTWPACNGQWLVPLDEPKLAVAWGHRVAALGVALALIATTALAWWTGSSRRIRGALTASALLYPAQVGIGAFAATTATPALLSAVHLVVGMAIFGGIVVALAWTLEPETFDDPEGVEDPDEIPDATEPEPSPTSDRPEGVVARAKRTGFAYFRLMKPRLMWLLCLV